MTPQRGQLQSEGWVLVQAARRAYSYSPAAASPFIFQADVGFLLHPPNRTSTLPGRGPRGGADGDDSGAAAVFLGPVPSHPSLSDCGQTSLDWDRVEEKTEFC